MGNGNAERPQSQTRDGTQVNGPSAVCENQQSRCAVWTPDGFGDSQKVAYVAQVIPVNELTNHIMLTAQLFFGGDFFSKGHEGCEARVPDDSNI